MGGAENEIASRSSCAPHGAAGARGRRRCRPAPLLLHYLFSTFRGKKTAQAYARVLLRCSSMNSLSRLFHLSRLGR